jgi:cytidine deaminase
MEFSDLTEGLKTLFQTAKLAAENSYSPYSHYKVGAAIITKSGKTFTGCNIENASYRVTLCAEQTAIAKAVSENETVFTALAVFCDNDQLFAPCGVCRQMLAEFSSDCIVVYGNTEKIIVSNISELLPSAFTL